MWLPVFCQKNFFYGLYRFQKIRQTGLLLTILFLTTACNTQNLSNGESESLQGSISVWVEMPPSLTKEQESEYQEPNQAVLAKTTEAFTDIYPHVKIFLKFFSSKQFWQSLELQSKRGSAPDLILISSIAKIPHLVRIGALQSLSDKQIDQSQFRPEALGYIQYQGKAYGLPMYLSTQVLCYNKDKVETPAKTLADLINQARQGYSVGIPSGFLETLWGAGISSDQLLSDRGQIMLTQSDQWMRWLEWLKQAQIEPNVVVSNNFPALVNAFIEKRLAYLVCSSEWIAEFNTTFDRDTLGITLLPSITNQPGTPLLWASVLLFNRASNAEQSQLALKLAHFITKAEQQAQLEMIIPIISTNKYAALNSKLFPIRSVILEQSKTAIPINLDVVEKVDFIQNHAQTIYQQVLKGEITPEIAVDQLNEMMSHPSMREK